MSNVCHNSTLNRLSAQNGVLIEHGIYSDTGSVVDGIYSDTGSVVYGIYSDTGSVVYEGVREN
jgi:hypothetical protein